MVAGMITISDVRNMVMENGGVKNPRNTNRKRAKVLERMMTIEAKESDSHSDYIATGSTIVQSIGEQMRAAPSKHGSRKVKVTVGKIGSAIQIDEDAMNEVPEQDRSAYWQYNMSRHADDILYQAEKEFLNGSVKSNPDGFNGILTQLDILSLDNVIQTTAPNAAAKNFSIVGLLTSQDNCFLRAKGAGQGLGIKAGEIKMVNKEHTDGSVTSKYHRDLTMSCGAWLGDMNNVFRMCNLDFDAITSNGSTSPIKLRNIMIDLMALAGDNWDHPDFLVVMPQALFPILLKQEDTINGLRFSVDSLTEKPKTTLFGKEILFTNNMITTEAPVV